MKLKLKHLSVFFLAFCLLTGCGKVQTNNNGSASSGITSEKKGASSSDSRESNEAFLKQEEEAEQTPVPKKAGISLKEHYPDSNRYVTVLGLKEYKNLKGDFGTDMPGKGSDGLTLDASFSKKDLKAPKKY